MGEHNSCDAKKLFLSLRDIASVVVQNGVIAVFKVHDEVVDMRGFCGIDNFFKCRVGVAVCDVFTHCTFLSQVSCNTIP